MYAVTVYSRQKGLAQHAWSIGAFHTLEEARAYMQAPERDMDTAQVAIIDTSTGLPVEIEQGPPLSAPRVMMESRPVLALVPRQETEEEPRGEPAIEPQEADEAEPAFHGRSELPSITTLQAPQPAAPAPLPAIRLELPRQTSFQMYVMPALISVIGGSVAAIAMFELLRMLH